ncbi:MAG: carbamoyl-phosphate synthase large subunit [Pseudomonadota bacterium]
MSKRTDIDTIVLLGAGPIVIGQACEFDYSGTQACKALREDGYRVVLINSNPATIMTDPETADATYIEPLTPNSVRDVINREMHAHPDETFAILPTMGGQVALNVALALSDSGFLAEADIELLGASPDVIRKADDRELFRDAMEKIGIECAKSVQVSSVEQGLAALDETGLPAILRPSFTLGGTGGGVAYTQDEFIDLLKAGLDASPANSVLVEESLLGWKEYELEVVRDKADNCIIVCPIENIDPMGIHTGDSITVAPALTLTDKEYQVMRDNAMACLRAIGVDTGGSNVQFAVDPKNGRQILIEMNPRVSRSSALASKATGFPIARIAAKLAIGYTLNEITNEITGSTPASFEPTIDYVVTKIPRFDFSKFGEAHPHLTTSMKSVGEVMSIGRNFAQSMQKALRSLEIGLTGFNETAHGLDREAILQDLEKPAPMRILLVAQALRAGIDADTIRERTGIDAWYVSQIASVVDLEARIRGGQIRLSQDRDTLLMVKKLGMSDARIGELAGYSEAEIAAFRRSAGIEPVIKKIDTCAAEFKCMTSFMYSSYEGDGMSAPECECDPSNRRKIVVLGSGPNRIGQGIEFDYCCVHACLALAEIGFETIMINCNPETVSTDYDSSDRLYFEPLTQEDVLEVLRKEQASGELVGVVVQLGGQTPLKLAAAIQDAGIPVLGTPPQSIDLSEDRERFKDLVERLGLKQPPNAIARSAAEAIHCAQEIGYPVVIRPSYVLGGQSMRIVRNDAELRSYIDTAVSVSNDRPVLIDGYLENAIEFDVDALCDGEEVQISGVMEHVEPAGIHSGDSACVIPPYSVPADIVEQLIRQTSAIAKELKVVGLINVQFAVVKDQIFLIEANPRASRTVPFVAKAKGVPVAKIAAQVIAGRKLHEFQEMFSETRGLYSVKEAVLPFKRFPGCDTVLGPEMKSTGEVMGIEWTLPRAFAKSQEAAGFPLDRKGAVVVPAMPDDRPGFIEMLKLLRKREIAIQAPPDVRRLLKTSGLESTAYEGDPFDALDPDQTRLVLHPDAAECGNPEAKRVREFALRNDIPCYTTMRSCDLAVAAMTQSDSTDPIRPCLQLLNQQERANV